MRCNFWCLRAAARPLFAEMKTALSRSTGVCAGQSFYIDHIRSVYILHIFENLLLLLNAENDVFARVILGPAHDIILFYFFNTIISLIGLSF